MDLKYSGNISKPHYKTTTHNRGGEFYNKHHSKSLILQAYALFVQISQYISLLKTSHKPSKYLGMQCKLVF